MRGFRTLLRRPVTWAVAIVVLLVAPSLLIVGCGQSGGSGGGGNGDTFEPGDAEEYAPGRSGEIVEVELPGPGDQTYKITFEEIDGLAVYQGDMILGEADFFRDLTRITELESQANATYRRICWEFLGIEITCHNYRWPNATVPYTFRDDWDDPATAVNENQMMRDRIRDAMDEIEAVTAVRFVPRSGQDGYIRFQSSDGCSAQVGYQGERQRVSLSTDCGEWVTVHEIGHALGLHHEQSRHDRASFVSIDEDNIEDGKGHNFEIDDNSYDIGSYDFDSLMHYGAWDFCRQDASGLCSAPVITTIPSGIPIGQRSYLSAGDIAALNRMYPGEPPTLAIASPSPGREFSRRTTNVSFSASVVDPEDMDVVVRWTSDRDGVLGVGNPLVKFTGDMSYGTHVVTARGTDPQGNASNTDTVTLEIVNDPPIVEIVSPPPGEFCIGEPIDFTAKVTDLNEVGATLPGSAVSWRVGAAAPFATGKEVTRGFDSPGSYQVIAKATDPLDLSSEDFVGIDIDDCVDQPPAVQITSHGEYTEYTEFDGFDTGRQQRYKEVTLTGFAEDEEDGSLTGGSLVWTTDQVEAHGGSSLLGTGASITVRLYAAYGSFDVTHTIKLTATDSGGNVREAFITIHIWTLG